KTPCGVAAGQISLRETYRSARAADEVSAFGGIVACNSIVDGPTANAMAETFLEAIVAPGFTEEAQSILAAKKSLRLLILPMLDRNAPRPAVAPRALRGLGD